MPLISEVQHYVPIMSARMNTSTPDLCPAPPEPVAVAPGPVDGMNTSTITEASGSDGREGGGADTNDVPLRGGYEGDECCDSLYICIAEICDNCICCCITSYGED